MGEAMIVDSDFKSEFYNLQGIHINERKKNFYKLLKSLSPDTPLEQIEIQPSSYQEKNFYVDVLIHLKRVEKLMEILQEGIGVLSSKILKQQWFFQEAFKNMGEDDIVNKFLPTLSYSLRMKVLKKLSLALSEERMDRIFDLVLERYGLFIAQQFLFSCSPEKIVHILKNNEVNLLPEQLKRILQKDINLIKVYLEEYERNTSTKFDDYDFLNYLAWKHPNLYFELELNALGNIKLGRYTTRSLLKIDKDKVLKEIQISTLNKATIVRDVKEFDKEYLYKFFPADLNCICDYNYRYNLTSLVSKYPLKKRWEVLSQAFKQAYKKDIVNHLDQFENNLATFFPTEIKQKWAEIKYINSDDLRYIKYYNPKKAFELLKEKINLTSDINQRGNLLNKLITVCYENKDYDTYEEVLKYICIRHRNVDRNIRADMIYHIARNIDYDQITDVHWKYINEIIDIQRVRSEPLSFENITEYLVYAYKKNIPLDGPVTQYVKDCIKSCSSFRFGHGKQLEAESNILKHIVKVLPSLALENQKKITHKIMRDIVNLNKDIIEKKNCSKGIKEKLVDFNKCGPIMDLIKEVCSKEKPYNSDDYDVMNNFVSYNYIYSNNPVKVFDEDRLLRIIKTMIDDKKQGRTLGDFVINVIRKPERNYFENNLLDYFFNNFKENYSYFERKKAVEYFLRKEPEVIAKYFNEILPVDIENSVLDYSVIKMYSHLELDKKIISYFKNFVSVQSACEGKGKLLETLSQVMNTKDFLDLIKEYTPKAKKLDLENEEQKRMYQVQCEIAKCFKNLNETSVLAPVLMHFCQGDYLQSSLAALYRVLYRINEEKSAFYINILGTRAMSTRKHAVFLGFKVLSLKEAIALYSVLSNKETNVSAKKYIFNAVLKYLLKNPLESILDVVFLDMNAIDKNDTEMIQGLTDSVNKIPNKYKPVFMEKVWNFVDVLEQQNINVVTYQKTLLDSITRHDLNFFSRLHQEFCQKVISKYFLSSNDKLQKRGEALFSFVVKYLLAYSDDQYFELVFNIIKTYKNLHWESNNKDQIKYIYDFFRNVYKNFDKNDVKFVKQFTNFWQHVFNHEECFYEYVLLRLMDLHKAYPNIEAFSKAVDKLFHDLINEYGPYVSDVLVESIKFFHSCVNTTNDVDIDLANFALYLLKSNSSEFNCFIVFDIIKDVSITAQNEIFFKVVDALKSVNKFSVRMHCNVLLKKN